MISIKNHLDPPFARHAAGLMRLYITAATAATAGGIAEI